MLGKKGVMLIISIATSIVAYIPSNHHLPPRNKAGLENSDNPYPKFPRPVGGSHCLTLRPLRTARTRASRLNVLRYLQAPSKG